MSTDRRDDGRPGDAAVDQAWRATAIDAPSARLDATILAAARAATARTRSAPALATRHWWAHWQPLAAAAGVAGLAFTVVQMLPRETAVPPTPANEQTIERALPGRSESTAQQGPPPSSPPPPPREAAAQRSTAAKDVSPEAVPQTAPSRGVAGAMAEADVSSEQRRRPLAPPAAAAPTPEEWARRIETLYGAGEANAAVDALHAFREAYRDADQYLAESLQPWAASVDKRPAQAKEPAGITP